MAHPLSDAGALPPQPGLRRLSGRPRGLRSLWAVVEAGSAAELEAALSALALAVDAPAGAVSGPVALVQIDWRGLMSAPAAAEIARRFAAERPGRVSTYIPMCHPGAPTPEALRAFATPPDCALCVFYRGRACQGLGAEAAPFLGLEGPPALRPVEGPVEGFGAADFAGETPVCYWRPRRADVRAMAAWARAAGGRIWDLGAGNGFISGLLAQEPGLEVTAVDRLDVYPAPAGVGRRVGDVRAVSAEARRRGEPLPDAVLISWPPGGDAFRDVVRALRPRVAIYAYDAAGFCGARPCHAVVRATAAGLTWFGRGRDDLAPLPGLRRVLRRAVSCHHDLRAGGAGASGVLEIRAADELAPADEVAASERSYPWDVEGLGARRT